jgi:uncharacterized protein (TIGR02284 family)
MAEDMKKVIEKLNDLIALDRDAVAAYTEAITRIHIPALKEALSQFRGDHQRHITDLSAVVSKYGGVPRTKTDVKGFFIKGFTAITSAMGDEAALRAMQGNETLTTGTYQKAMKEKWPADVLALIQKNFADEQRHLTFIREAIQMRRWEQEAAHP